jgi:hypothetical protein
MTRFCGTFRRIPCSEGGASCQAFGPHSPLGCHCEPFSDLVEEKARQSLSSFWPHHPEIASSPASGGILAMTTLRRGTPSGSRQEDSSCTSLPLRAQVQELEGFPQLPAKGAMTQWAGRCHLHLNQVPHWSTDLKTLPVG